MKFFIKYMVSIRCKMIVREELKKLGFIPISLDLGEAEILEELNLEQYRSFQVGLLRSGLELMEDKKAILIEKIKNVVVEIVHYSDDFPKVKNSHYISEKCAHNYTYLANLFLEVTGTTIEHFIINHKIERVKELLIYDELNLTEISYSLNYSSAAHLSAQFKKVTGLTPSYFKKLKLKRLITLESL